MKKWSPRRMLMEEQWKEREYLRKFRQLPPDERKSILRFVNELLREQRAEGWKQTQMGLDNWTSRIVSRINKSLKSAIEFSINLFLALLYRDLNMFIVVSSCLLGALVSNALGELAWKAIRAPGWVVASEPPQVVAVLVMAIGLAVGGIIGSYCYGKIVWQNKDDDESSDH